jgi:4-amino-4-deoxy-L-arabinose transferase-like glycosyltransferase
MNSSVRRTANGRSHLRWLAGILLVALVLRVLWVAVVQPDPRDGRTDDTWVYYTVSRTLADGDGYVDIVEQLPTASVLPGYPAILSLLFLLPGDDVAAARAFNVFLGVAMVAGVYYLGSRLWDRRAGLIAAGTMALFPSHIFFASLLMREPLFAAALVGFLCLALAWTIERRPSPLQVLLLGVVAGFVVMVRTEGFAVVGVIVLAWLLIHRSWRRVAAYSGLLLLGMAVLIVPWTVRNAVQVGSPVVTYTGGGVVLAEAHHADAGGRPAQELSQSMGMRYAIRFQNLPQPERDVRKDREALADSFRYAFTHIPGELSLMPHRLAWFFRGERDVLFFIQNAPPGEPRELSSTAEGLLGGIADGYYYAVAGVMVLGLPFWLGRMRRRHVLLWGPFAAYCAMWAFLFAGLPRYHFPLVPIFAVLGGIGLAAF